MKSKHHIGDVVTFRCHILGWVRGSIKRFVIDISNGQPYAEIELLPPHTSHPLVTEPTINLEVA